MIEIEALESVNSEGLFPAVELIARCRSWRCAKDTTVGSFIVDFRAKRRSVIRAELQLHTLLGGLTGSRVSTEWLGR